MPAVQSWGRVAVVAAALSVIAAACSSGGNKGASPTTTTSKPSTSSPAGGAVTTADIHKISHVVVIMQENRSFDSYFGTYPGADGIPASACVPDASAGGCDKPYHSAADRNIGGPHGQTNATADINGGKMDGFVNEAGHGPRRCQGANDPNCAPGAKNTDVMGYHDAREIPNYWDYAKNFVLQDRMFEPNASWSLPEHLFQVSEWSAHCTVPGNPSSCVNAVQNPGNPPDFAAAPNAPARPPPDYAWTDLTYLLHRDKVNWGYYVVSGTEPDCENDAAISCVPRTQGAKTPGIWNPLPFFDTVKADNQLGNIQSVANFYQAAQVGDLPAVSWVVPSGAVSEHPPGLVSAGQSYVTSLVNAVMRSRDWSSTAIFLAWDDWGGFYDHVQPPTVTRTATASGCRAW
jgi:phospholipase C